MWDSQLSGKDNLSADRAVGDVFVDRFPGAVAIARDNRLCLARAVRYIATELGIGQFLDLGSGLPTADNVHQVARRVNPPPASCTRTSTRSSSRTDGRCWKRTTRPAG